MIALLGLGTVGQGVVEILQKYPTMKLQKVLVRSPQKPAAQALKHLITEDFADVLNDSAIKIILDCTGADSAYDWFKKAMAAGKHVVTANKKLVSEHLEELTALAEQNGVAFLYEASVGGGIPLLKPLRDNRQWNDISQVAGVLNGTSNYILTNMSDQSYQTVLQKAQQLGYAESDPTADVGGYDARRKLRIMASMAFNGMIDETQIIVRGIQDLSQADLMTMAELGFSVKQFAKAWRSDDAICAYVMPCAISNQSAVAHLDGTENIGLIYGEMSGPLAFSGFGAGKLPTAYSMLVDAWDIHQDKWSNCLISTTQLNIKPFRAKFYYRFNGAPDDELLALAEREVGSGYISKFVEPEVFKDFDGALILIEEEQK
ncbi:MAG: homoserine dehydrogenase [Clostridiales bacterium]|nr:MAG: homoserine dehydrogenase [Clostridiales bacterium]